MSKFAMKFFRSLIVSASRLLGAIEISKMDVQVISFDMSLPSARTLLKVNALETSFVRPSQLRVSHILPSSGCAQIATTIIQRIVVAMVHFFSWASVQKDLVHHNCTRRLLDASGRIKFLPARMERGKPIPLREKIKIFGVNYRVLIARKWDQAIRWVRGLNYSVAFHAFFHRCTSHALKFSLYLILFLLPLPVLSQGTPVALLPSPYQVFYQSFNVPAAGGCLFFYQSGTSTPLGTYTDVTGTILQSNPVILDVFGGATVYLQNAEYRVQLWSSGGSNCASGSQIWSKDGVSAYQILNSTNNIVFASVTSDPTGQQGELGPFRSDLGCLRFFVASWDCVSTNNATATIGNKTFDVTANILKNSSNTAGHYLRNNGTQYVDSAIQTGDVSVVTQTYPNNGAGTSTNLLTGFFTTGFNAVSSLAAPATQDAIGVCVSGCGTTGTATLITYGQASCVFDNTSSAGDYVTTSATTIGNCHDAGATYPISTVGQIVGRVAAGSSVPAGLNTIVFFGAELKPISLTVAKVDLGNQGANITSTPLFTPTANGFYRLSCYLVVSQAATSTSTLPTCGVLWTDADTSTSESVTVTGAVSTNTVGTISIPGTGTNLIYAKSGVAISYQTAGYATSGATSMQYALHLRLEGPF